MVQLCPWVVLVPSIPPSSRLPAFVSRSTLWVCCVSFTDGAKLEQAIITSQRDPSLMAALSYLSPPLLLRGPGLNLAQQEAGKGLDRAIFGTPCLTVIEVFKYWTSPAIGLWCVSLGARGKLHSASQLSGTSQLYWGCDWHWQVLIWVGWGNTRYLFQFPLCCTILISDFTLHSKNFKSKKYIFQIKNTSYTILCLCFEIWWDIVSVYFA